MGTNARAKRRCFFFAGRRNIENYFLWFKAEVENRLQKIYAGIINLKNKKYKVDAIAPQAAIYLTIKVDLVGKTTERVNY